MSNQEKPEKPDVNAEANSIAVGSISVGGDVKGSITIGNTTGFTAEQVSVLVTQIQSTFQPKPFDGRCPYKGLDVFEEEDAELFFGREKLVADLVSRVKDSRTVFVTGPSGSGKSSLVRAGLIHALKQGGLEDSERWLYATMKPGRDPIGDLGRVVSSLASSTNPEDEIRTKAMKDATIFARWCEIALKEGRDKRLVLFIDQFEEVFTQIRKEEERIAFLNLLTHAATIESGRVIILFSMRSDFVSNCATYPQLNALLNQQFVQIGAMQPEELVSAIAQPALRVGLQIDPDLIAQIISDMKSEPGSLPLMQFALKDLFEARQAQGGMFALTLNDYLQRGGIQKSLERHADAAFAKLGNNEQELARSQELARFIFSGLIEIGRDRQATRRTALFTELVPTDAKDEDVEIIVRKLADARLIITNEQDGRDTVTISHEKLLDAWSWLKKLVIENGDVIALKNEISENAVEWDEEHQRDASYLYSGARLAIAREKTKNLNLSGTAKVFLQTAIQTEDRARLQRQRTRRGIFTGLVSFSAVVLVLLIVSLVQLNISRAQQLGSQAQAAFAEQNYNTALLYAYQSNQIHKNDAADLVLRQIPYKNFALGKALYGYSSSVYSVAWSLDGQLASGSADGTVILWDLKTGQPAQTLTGHSSSVYSVAWSPDGQLASGSDDGTVILRDLKTGQPAQTLTGHTSSVYSVAWSLDGQLASGSDDGTVILWDLKTGQPAQTLTGHTSSVYSVAWSPNGQLASGSGDGTVILWDLKTGQPAQTLKGHTASVNSVAWSPDGQLASGSHDATLTIWDLKTGKPAQTLIGYTGFVYSVAWSAEGQLASGSDDGTVTLWDLKTGQPSQIIKGHTNIVNSVAWSPDGQLASASDDNTVILWNLKTDQPAQTLKPHTYNDPLFASKMAWSPTGQLASGSFDGTVILWDLKAGQPAQNLKGHADTVKPVAWSPAGQLASGSFDGTVIVWDLETGQPAQVLRGHTDNVNSVAWSPDGQLASGSWDYTVILWDLKTGQPAQILRGHTLNVNSVAWSPDGQLASGSDDGTVIVWDLETGQPAQILTASTGWVATVAWSPDGQLASGSKDGTVILWDIRTGRPAQILKGHTQLVRSVAWSTNGQLASGSDDGTVILWDLKTGQPAQTFKGHPGSVSSVAWSPNGQLASDSADGTIDILRTDLIGKDFCNKIIRNLTLQEWLDSQGWLYIYRPACSNLYNPTVNLDPLNSLKSGDISTVLITWKGRAIFLALLLTVMVLFIFIMWILYKSIPWLWRKTRG